MCSYVVSELCLYSPSIVDSITVLNLTSSVGGKYNCVCVCSRKRRQSGTSVGFTPGNWAYISHRTYARLFSG